MSGQELPFVEGPYARWPRPSMACWSRIVLRLEAIVQNIRWSRLVHRSRMYQQRCWRLYISVIGRDGILPASTIWTRYMGMRVPRDRRQLTDIVPSPDYLDSDLEEVEYC